MSAMNAATRMKEGEYRDYYERKLKEGKHVMCALNVLRAKLVHRMFSVIRRDEEYYSTASSQNMKNFSGEGRTARGETPR